MQESIAFDQVLKLAKQLSSLEKIRLIEQVAPEIEHELLSARPTRVKSLWGLCAHLGQAPSAEEIDQARRKAWANFPREDI